MRSFLTPDGFDGTAFCRLCSLVPDLLWPMLAGGAGGYVIPGGFQYKAASPSAAGYTPATGAPATAFTIKVDLRPTMFGTYRTIFSAIASSGQTDANCLAIRFETDNTLSILGWTTTYLRTTQVFRDPIAYGTLVVAGDSNQATPDNRMRVYWGNDRNGYKEITSFSTRNNPALGATFGIGGAVLHQWGATGPNLGQYNPFDGYMASKAAIVGQQMTPDSFYELDKNNYWVNKAFGGLTFGANGGWWEDGATEKSGTGNDLTLSNVSFINDSPTNSPANDVGLFPVFSAIDWAVHPRTISGAGLRVDATCSYAVNTFFPATLPLPTTGRWIWAVECPTVGLGPNTDVGIIPVDTSRNLGATAAAGIGSSPVGYSFGSDGANTKKFNNNSGTTLTGVSSFSDGVKVVCAYDADNLKLWFGTISGGVISWADGGDPEAGTNEAFTVGAAQYLPAVGFNAGTAGRTIACVMDFGATGTIGTSLPSGFKLLCTAHFDEPECPDPDQEYYAENIVKGVGDYVVTLPWDTSVYDTMVRIKPSDATGSWLCYDTVRGENYYLAWNSADVQGSHSGIQFSGNTVTVGLTAWAAAGSYFFEAFKAGQWFQIKTFTGTGVAHAETLPGALAEATGFMFLASLGGADHICYHTSLGATKYLWANSQGAADTSAAPWNNTEPTTAQITVGTSSGTNANGVNYVAYVWANGGPYWFGKYTGNGSTDGPLFYIGGHPALNWVKRSSDVGDYMTYAGIYNTPANVNPIIYDMRQNTTAANAISGGARDHNSNNMKQRGTNAFDNASGGTYVSGSHGVRALRGPGTAQARAA